jgi:hypothetical protein
MCGFIQVWAQAPDIETGTRRSGVLPDWQRVFWAAPLRGNNIDPGAQLARQRAFITGRSKAAQATLLARLLHLLILLAHAISTAPSPAS